jgi:microcompartment protein CcmK/EutM
VKIARVIGTLVSTEKHVAYVGHKVLYCQPLDERRAETGDAFVAVDRAQAGVGDTVLVIQEGNGARQILGTIDGKLPIRSVIVGIVDAIDVAE